MSQNSKLLGKKKDDLDAYLDAWKKKKKPRSLVKKQLQYIYCPISHEVKQTDNETWSINRIKQEKYFSWKIMQKMKQED